MAENKVLIVDDEPKVLAAIKRNQRDLKLKTAENGQQALDILNRENDYTVVVSDLHMPGISGIELFSSIAESHPDTVRILLTGDSDFSQAVKAVNQGHIFRFLTKPCPPETLSRAIQDGFQYHQMIQAQRELHSLSTYNKVLEGVILVFLGIVEFRDPYTAGHQKRVADLSVAMGKELGMDERRLRGLKIAALIHDIGKIYVPAEFLNKPGELSDVEFSIIMKHPEVGHDILKPLDSMWKISEFVLQHHERMDGSGYPNGLKGDEITMEARIIAVADVMDAISNHRPYRPSLGLKKALEELKQGRGTLYDAKAVDACVKVLKQQDFPYE